MAINDRIKFIRNLRGMTQKYLGQAIGFPEKSADVRMAQYEIGNRTPKEKMVADLAKELAVSTFALEIPNFDHTFGVVHSLFALEDSFGLKLEKQDDKVCFTIEPKDDTTAKIAEIIAEWYDKAEMLQNGEITKEEYDNWRYRYPETKHQTSLWKNIAPPPTEN